MKDKKFIVSAILQFRESAFEVIELICEYFELDARSDHPFLELQRVINNRRQGQFKNWNYRFHGDACEFIHINTHQQLDIKTNRKGHFDAITGYSLFRFIQTTSYLNKQYPNITENRIHKILNELKNDQVLENVGDEFAETWILSTTNSE